MAVDIQPGAIVCKDAILEGTHRITIQDKCVLHPHCRIFALQGDIIIEAGTIIEEFVVIMNMKSGTLVIGRNNHFKVGAKFMGEISGNNNVFECKSVVSEGCVIADGCVVGTKCRTSVNEVLDSGTVLYGLNARRTKDTTELVDDLHMKQLALLADLLPKFNQMRT